VLYVAAGVATAAVPEASPIVAGAAYVAFNLFPAPDGRRLTVSSSAFADGGDISLVNPGERAHRLSRSEREEGPPGNRCCVAVLRTPAV
jgi:hypothetical protein